MARGWLTYDGTDLRVFGLYTSGYASFKSPAKVQEQFVIPGRDGALLANRSRLENVQIEFPCFIHGDFRKQFDALKGFLLSRSGYCVLEDSRHPNKFRQAAFAAEIAPDVASAYDAGSFSLAFNCKPQAYLTDGQAWQDLGDSIENPTYFAARPLLAVTGAGTLDVGSVRVTITEAPSSGPTYIDCDVMEAYDENGASRNAYVEISGNEFPTIGAGTTGIVMDGVTAKIMPRWWEV